MAVLLPNGKQYYTNTATGLPLVGGKVYTYAAGTTTPKATYTTAAADVPNANPVILDARGEATIFWSGVYKIVLKDSLDNTIYTIDNVSSLTSASDILYGTSTLDEILLSGSITTVDSIADLAAVDSSVFQTVFVSGYYAKGDGGGGTYYYDSSDTTSSSNGGSIIVASNSARWKLIDNGKPLSVLQFGAKPDGATDASTAFTNALTALGSSGGVVTVKGSFYLSNNVVMPAGTQLVGFSKAVLRNDGEYNASHYQSMITIASGSSIKIKSGCALSGLLIVEKRCTTAGAYPMPFVSDAAASAAIAGYTGTAILSDATLGETWLSGKHYNDLTIIGFQYGIKDNLNNNVYSSFNNVLADCNYGIITRAQNPSGSETDAITSLKNCVASSISTNGLGYTAAYRTGIGITATGSNGGYVYMSDCSASYADGGFALENVYANGISVRGSGTVNGIYISGRAVIKGADIQCTTDAVTLGATASEYSIEDIHFASPCDKGFVFTAGAGYGRVRGYNDPGGSFALTSGDATALAKCRISDKFSAVSFGSFTPSLKFSGGSSGMVYSKQVGTYYMVGNHCFGTVYITLTAKGVSIGAATITGLPVTSSANTDSLGHAVCVKYSGFNALAGDIFGYIAESSATISLKLADTSAADIDCDNGDFTNTSVLVLNFSYPTDSLG